MPSSDVFWYCLKGMGAQEIMPKKVIIALFPYIFHVKTKIFLDAQLQPLGFLDITKLSNP